MALAEDSRVFTWGGFKNVSEIVPGDLVVTPTGWSSIIRKSYSGRQETIRIETSKGILQCTDYTQIAICPPGMQATILSLDDLEWILAKDLTLGTLLVTPVLNSPTTVELRPIHLNDLINDYSDGANHTYCIDVSSATGWTCEGILINTFCK